MIFTEIKNKLTALETKIDDLTALIHKLSSYENAAAQPPPIAASLVNECQQNDKVQEETDSLQATSLNTESNQTEKCNNDIFSFSEQKKLFKNINNNETLREIFLDDSNEIDSEKAVVALIVKAANWDNILRAWDKLAVKCKEESSKADDLEIDIMKKCLDLHNLRWTGKEAALVDVHEGESFDFKIHQRIGTVSGEVIKKILLSGLKNAGGDLQKKSLVMTTDN